jgi:7,8-dihydropterin-6-yl-methyl-4-(beta-D-ribofuranosyl)aminobenzene 5'-phosphate synthase
MKISVLTDNHPGARTPAEHGLSYLIEYDGIRILFDTGQSDMFLKNAEAMNVSLANIDKIILSHGHFDHGNGLSYLSGHRLLCHPGCFVKRYRKSDRSYIGLKDTGDELSGKFELITSTKPVRISEKILFLGEIPRLTSFESRTTSFVFEDWTSDYVQDDSAVALLLSEGLFVVTGCGHAGIVNTLEHAKKVTGINSISGIMGGFHLKEIDNQTKQTIRYLKKNKVKHILPSHCTELPALSVFYENFGIRQIKTGDILNI